VKRVSGLNLIIAWFIRSEASPTPWPPDDDGDGDGATAKSQLNTVRQHLKIVNPQIPNFADDLESRKAKTVAGVVDRCWL
jgi:hypothetical protein